MGIFLNSKTPFQLFCDEAAATYFVDKSQMLCELIPLAESSEKIIVQDDGGRGKDNRYICITRPRRFGKTMMASMIAAFFGKGKDSKAVFEKLRIGACKKYQEHINRHNVIYNQL